MNGLPYYKAYPRDFFEGTRQMGFELKGAYRLLLDLIYMHGGKLYDDPRFIAGQLGCSVKKWNLMLAELVAMGKISASDGFLRNLRADKELEILRLFQDKQRENASVPRKNNGLDEAMAKPKPSHTEPEPYPDKKKVEAKASLALADQDECFRHFNETAERVGWAKVQVFSQPRRAALSQRIKSVGGVDQWCEAINRAALSPLLTGQSNSGWRADFDWLAKPANFTKVMEGNYDERNAAGNHNGAGTRPGPHNALMAGFAMAADRLKN